MWEPRIGHNTALWKPGARMHQFFFFFFSLFCICVRAGRYFVKRRGSASSIYPIRRTHAVNQVNIVLPLFMARATIANGNPLGTYTNPWKPVAIMIHRNMHYSFPY
jgi:hypothetical protein